MLLGLSIAAALLTATAYALDASVKSYQVNQEQASLLQRARTGVHRMLTTIRAGSAHEPYDADAQDEFADGHDVDDTGIRLDAVDGTETVFRYDAANKRVLAEVNGTTHVMVDDVEEFAVRMEPMQSAIALKSGGDHYDLLRRATIKLTVRIDGANALPGEKATDNTLTISSSAMPRRNAW